MTKRRDCGGGRKLCSKNAEKRTRSKATTAKLQSNYEKRAATESASRVVEREKGKAAHLQFFQGTGSSTAGAPVAAPPPSILLRLGVRRAHRHDDSTRLRRPLRPRGHPSRAPVLLLPLLRVKLLNNLHVFD